MAKSIPIYASRSQEVAAYVLVDDADYERVAAHRWLMQGEPSAPGYVYRYRPRCEREAHENHVMGLAEELLRRPDRITFANGDRLDYRRANLVSRGERRGRHHRSAQELAAASAAGCSGSDGAMVELPLTQGWTAWLDPEWAERVSGYSWCARTRRGRGDEAAGVGGPCTAE